MLERKSGFLLAPRKIVSKVSTFKRRAESSKIVVLGQCPTSMKELLIFSETAIKLKLDVLGIAILATNCEYAEHSTFLTSLRKALRQPKIPALTTGKLEVFRRILNAHVNNASDKLIASASIMGDSLSAWSCEPRLYQVAIQEIPGLKGMSKKHIVDFEISASGSRISWKHSDIDLNLESIRYLSDQKFRIEIDKKKVKEIKAIGESIRALRKSASLNQKDCGITEREMRRIEKGEVLPHSSTLKKIAKAHGLDLANYLNRLANTG